MTPRAARAARTARSLAGAGVAAALVVGLLSAPPAPAQAARARPAGPTVDRAAAAAQCGIGLGRPQKGSAAKASQLMAGRADLGQYGWFRLASNPSWKPVSTLDSSGKGYMHSLHYLLPLLRRGVKTGNSQFVARFYALLRDWYRDNKPGGPTSRYAWGPPIYEGFRSLVFVCAAAGPRGDAPWLARALQQQGEMAASSRRYEGVNNASLHQQMGLYAVAVTLGRPAWRRLAVARIAALAARLVHDDGSDEEGALTYAQNNYRWFRQASERLRRAGDPVPAELARVEAIPGFLAQATRPDGRLEALGDSSPTLLSGRSWTGTAAEWQATNGTSGVAPSATFSAYAGGYVFGRSGWGSAQRPLAEETYYSIRAGRADGIPHAHDDAAAVTLYSRGAPLLLDTGQWKYAYGPTRSFVMSRAAHNVVLVDGVRRTNPRPDLTTAQVGGLDIATVVDRGYQGVTLTRTVAYDRVEDVLLVWDRLESRTPVTASQQWGLGRDREVRRSGDVAHTRGPGANVSLFFTAGGAPLDVAAGRRRPMRGWNSVSYGELSPSPSLRATQKGTSLSWLTVIAPRADGVPGTDFSATSSVSPSAASVVLATPSGSATVTLDGTGGSRTVPTTLTPQASAAEPIVLAGSTTTVRGRGLTPGAPATLEALSPGATAWAPVTSGTATAAGTVQLPVTVPTTPAAMDYRLVSGATPGVASQPTRVTVAVAPQPPASVTASPSGRGLVTVSWAAPAERGGAPLSSFAVRINGRRVVAPGGASSVQVTGIVAGARVARVRAANAVGVSGWSRVPVAVPAYPSVRGPATARRGSRVRLALAGLLAGERATVTVRTVPSGAVTTRRVRAGADGTAVLRVRVRATVMVRATSGGVTSGWRRVRVARRR